MGSTGADSFRVIILTGGPVLDRDVIAFAGAIENEPGIELAAIVSQSPRRGTFGIIADLWRRRGVLALPLMLLATWKAFSREAFSPRTARRERRILRELGSRIHFVPDLHEEAVIERVRSLRPDLGLVYGGPILKPALFEVPVHGTLGIHHGKVPEYRGKKTTFWAIYHGEKEAGVTIQRIGNQLDGGAIAREATVPVTGRLPSRVKKELARLGIALYLEAIRAVRDGKAEYHPQPQGGGRLFRDPRPADIMRFWGRYLVRMLRR